MFGKLLGSRAGKEMKEHLAAKRGALQAELGAIKGKDFSEDLSRVEIATKYTKNRLNILPDLTPVYTYWMKTEYLGCSSDKLYEWGMFTELRANGELYVPGKDNKEKAAAKTLMSSLMASDYSSWGEAGRCKGKELQELACLAYECYSLVLEIGKEKKRILSEPNIKLLELFSDLLVDDGDFDNNVYGIEEDDKPKAKQVIKAWGDAFYGNGEYSKAVSCYSYADWQKEPLAVYKAKNGKITFEDRKNIFLVSDSSPEAFELAITLASESDHLPAYIIKKYKDDPALKADIDSFIRKLEMYGDPEVGNYYQALGDIEKTFLAFSKHKDSMALFYSGQVADPERAFLTMLKDGWTFDEIKAAFPPHNVTNFDIYTDFLTKNERYDEAAKIFETGGDLEEAARQYDYAGDIAKAASLYVEYGSIDQAIELYRANNRLYEAVDLAVQAGDLRLAAAMSEESGNKARAAELYLRAGDIDKGAAIYVSQGKFKDAATVLADNDRPADAAALLMDGKLYAEAAGLFEELGQLPEAAQAFSQAGENSKAAGIHARLGNWAEAAQLFMEGGEYGPAIEAYVNADDYENVFAASLKAGEYETALEHVSKLGNKGVLLEKIDEIPTELLITKASENGYAGLIAEAVLGLGDPVELERIESYAQFYQALMEEVPADQQQGAALFVHSELARDASTQMALLEREKQQIIESGEPERFLDALRINGYQMQLAGDHSRYADLHATLLNHCLAQDGSDGYDPEALKYFLANCLMNEDHGGFQQAKGIIHESFPALVPFSEKVGTALGSMADPAADWSGIVRSFDPGPLADRQSAGIDYSAGSLADAGLLAGSEFSPERLASHAANLKKDVFDANLETFKDILGDVVTLSQTSTHDAVEPELIPRFVRMYNEFSGHFRKLLSKQEQVSLLATVCDTVKYADPDLHMQLFDLLENEYGLDLSE